MPSGVFDTNVLASGFVRSNPAAAPAQLLDRWRAGEFILVLSEHILSELAATLREPYFRRRLTSVEVNQDFSLLRRRATIVPITIQVEGVATHPEDDLVIATALTAAADYLVTGDRKLQRLGTFQSVTILSPRDFVGVLRQARGAR